MLVFVDRYFKGSYRYVPLRTAVLRECRQNGGRLYFIVELKEYLRMEEDKFAEWLESRTSNANFPRLTADDPENGDDGYYAIETTSGATFRGFETGDQVWSRTVKRLSLSQRFLQPPSTKYIFLKSDISYPWGNRAAQLQAKTGQFRVDRNQAFTLRISYMWPVHWPYSKYSACIGLH